MRKPLFLVALLCVASSFAYGQAPTTFYGCMDKNGVLTVVSASAVCKSGSTKIQWNDPGPQGPQGPQGIPGTTGQAVQYLTTDTILPDPEAHVVIASTTIGGSNAIHLVTYHASFANPDSACTATAVLFVDGNPADFLHLS